MSRAAFLLIVMLTATAHAAPGAEQLYWSGKVAYDRNDYSTAIADWSKSYRLSKAPGLLFNLAQAYRKSGDCVQALARYKHFLTLDPTAASEDRRDANALVRELEPQCGSDNQPSPSAERPIEHPGRSMKIAGAAVGGAGIVALSIGIGLGYRASSLGTEVKLDCAGSTGCMWGAEQAKDAAGRRDAKVGYALDAVGAISIVSGAVFYYLGERDSEVQVTPLTAQANERGAVVSWRTSW